MWNALPHSSIACRSSLYFLGFADVFSERCSLSPGRGVFPACPIVPLQPDTVHDLESQDEWSESVRKTRAGGS